MIPYNIFEYKTVNYQYKKMSFISIVLLMIGIIILMCSYKFKVYNKYLLVKDNDEYLLYLNVLEEDKFLENKDILINNKKYSYSIISSSGYTNIDNNIYDVLHINIKKYDSVSNYSYVYTLKSNRTILNTLYDMLFGGSYG